MLFFLMNWKCWKEKERKSLHKNTLVCFILELVCFIHDRYIKFNISLKFQSRHLFFSSFLNDIINYVISCKRKKSFLYYLIYKTLYFHITHTSSFLLFTFSYSFFSHLLILMLHTLSIKKKVKKEVGCSSTRK